MLDDPRDDESRPDDETGGAPVRSPWEPPREDGDDGPPTGEYAPPRPDGGVGDDFFARLNAPPPGLEGEPEPPEPPFAGDNLDVYEEPERAPSKAATVVAFAVVVMAVLGVLMTAASVKLFIERAEMRAALGASIDGLTTVYAGPQASDTSRRRIAWLQKAIDDGDFAQAQKAIASLGAPETDRPSPLEDIGAGADGERRELPEPAEDTNLPLKAQVFFEQHPELWEAFFGFSVAIRRMEGAEMQVDDLEQLRAGMVKAAELGQTKKVEDLLNQAREAVEGQSAERLPQSLQAKLQQFGEAMRRAQQERRDVRSAVAFAKRSERAAQQGNIERAEQLMDRAIAAVKDAPRMREPRGAPGGQAAARARRMPRMGPEIGLLRFIADLAGSVMRAEDRDLTQIWESVNIAAGAIREKNADQVREILDEAKDALHTIGDRRRGMSRAIQQAQEQIRDARPAGPADRADRQQERRRQEVVVKRVTEMLERIREMPQDEFEGNRAAIARSLLAAMTAPVPLRPEETDEQPELTPEERVRRKMQIAGAMYRELTERPEFDADELDETFRKVRELIAEHQYERAEELVDEGVARMRRMAGDAALPADEPADTEGYGPQLQFDAPAPTLDLRDAPAPLTPLPVEPAPAAADDTHEGAEQ